MSEEEKQAIKIVNDYLLYSNINRTENDESCELVKLKVPKAMRKVLNLIEKQEKVIDNMAIAIDVLSKPKGAFKSICLPTNNTEQIKKEFYREVENV